MTTDISDLGNYVTVTVYGNDVDACLKEAIRVAHDRVFADGRTADVDTFIAGRHGGAYVTGAGCIIRFA